MSFMFYMLAIADNVHWAFTLGGGAALAITGAVTLARLADREPIPRLLLGVAAIGYVIVMLGMAVPTRGSIKDTIALHKSLRSMEP